MFAQAKNIEPDLVSQFNCLKEISQALRGANQFAGTRIRRQLGE